jgi:hypothetical protein
MALIWGHGYSAASDKCESDKLEAIAEEAKRNDDITRTLESELAKAKQQARTNRQTLKAELANPGYDCPIPRNGVFAINAAASNPR